MWARTVICVVHKCNPASVIISLDLCQSQHGTCALSSDHHAISWNWYSVFLDLKRSNGPDNLFLVRMVTYLEYNVLFDRWIQTGTSFAYYFLWISLCLWRASVTKIFFAQFQAFSVCLLYYICSFCLFLFTNFLFLRVFKYHSVS